MAIIFLLALSPVALSCNRSEETKIQPLEDLAGGFAAPHVQDIGPYSARIVFRAEEVSEGEACGISESLRH
jgi:hypothetical protein